MQQKVETVDSVLPTDGTRGTTSLRTPACVGLLTILLGAGGLLLWSSIALLASAVIIPGIVVVETGRKVVQHQDGGVIKSIDVAEGARVAAGQCLVTLDGSQLYAAEDTLRRLLAMNTAERLRLRAEREGSETVQFPSDVARVGKEVLFGIAADELRLFHARRASLEGKVRTLDNEAAGALQAAANLDKQVDLQRTRVALMQQELDDTRRLLGTHDTSRQHVLEVTRSLAELNGETEELISREDDAKQRYQHSTLESLRTTATFIESVDTDLQQSEKSRLDLVEKLSTVEEQIDRLRVVAPVAGRIVNLSVHTIGGVVGAGVTLLEIVPEKDPLEVVGEVRPEDIDNVRAGLPADIALTGFVGQQLPKLTGVVLGVSADRLEDTAKGTAFFRVRVSIPTEARSLLGTHELRPGMAVTLMLCKGRETPIQYLISPMMAFFAKAMRA